MKFLFFLFATIFLLAGCELEKVLSETSSNTVTEQEVANGLKEALTKGISEGSTELAQIDGYFKNPQIKIPFPPKAQKIANTLRDLGLGEMVDRVELSLNRAAEDAAREAKPIFVKAIREMTIADAMNILFGTDDAATQYLRKKTYAQLVNKFTPVITNSLDKVEATKYWDDVITRYNQIPFVEKQNPDLTAYVTDKALDGLFFVVAQEEKLIRENPVERTSYLLKKVFNYYDQNKGSK